MRSLFFLFLLPLCLNAQEVSHLGAMRNVMMGISLDNHIQWDTLAGEHLYGIGPLEQLTGEVTVVDGQIYLARVDATGQMAVTREARAAGPFGVFADVPDFLSIKVEGIVKGLDELEAFIAGLAAEAGWNLEQAFPFLIEGGFSEIGIHVIDKPEGEEAHGHEAHAKAKRHFAYQDISGTLVGFYSRHHEGVFTHRSEFIHVHFIDENRQVMGHLDELAFSGEMVVFLPVKN